jgi:hypothetical protein
MRRSHICVARLLNTLLLYSYVMDPQGPLGSRKARTIGNPRDPVAAKVLYKAVVISLDRSFVLNSNKVLSLLSNLQTVITQPVLEQ